MSRLALGVKPFVLLVLVALAVAAASEDAGNVPVVLYDSPGVDTGTGEFAAWLAVSLAVHAAAMLQSSVPHDVKPKLACIAAAISKASRAMLVCMDNFAPSVICTVVQGVSD